MKRLWAFCRIVVTRRSGVRGARHRQIPATFGGWRLVRSYIQLQNSSRESYSLACVCSPVETYPLAEAPKAYDRVAEGKARFRAVLTMESPIRSVRINGLLFHNLSGKDSGHRLRSEGSAQSGRGRNRPTRSLSSSGWLCLPSYSPMTSSCLFSTWPRNLRDLKVEMIVAAAPRIKSRTTRRAARITLHVLENG